MGMNAITFLAGAVVSVRLLVAAAAVLVIYLTLGSAIRTVVLPRGVRARISRVVFIAMRWVFRIRAGRNASYERRDAVMASYAPVSLVALLATWMVLVFAGYVALYWAVGGHPLYDAYELSGSSIFTLGFNRPGDWPSLTLSFSESALGLFLLALLITYLPTLSAGFSRREIQVTALEIRAGTPPWGVTMLERYWRLRSLDRLGEVWTKWEEWFSDLEETHTSYPALNFFRSPQPDHSWVTAGGAVMDAAALRSAVIDAPRDIDAEVCIRAGYLALRRICDFFGITYEANPKPDDPISIQREEFDAAYDELAQAGLPLKADREQGWRDFAGWRINYDTPLLALAALTMAAYAPWSSDRGLKSYTPSLLRRRGPVNWLAERD